MIYPRDLHLNITGSGRFGVCECFIFTFLLSCSFVWTRDSQSIMTTSVDSRNSGSLMDNVLGIFQSVVYGNDQLLKKSNSESIPTANSKGIPIVEPTPNTTNNNTNDVMDATTSTDSGILAMFQSLVYGNDQLLKKRGSIVTMTPSTVVSKPDQNPLTTRMFTSLTHDGVAHSDSIELKMLLDAQQYDSDAIEYDLEDQTESNILSKIPSQKCSASLMRMMFNRPCMSIQTSFILTLCVHCTLLPHNQLMNQILCTVRLCQ